MNQDWGAIKSRAPTLSSSNAWGADLPVALAPWLIHHCKEWRESAHEVRQAHEHGFSVLFMAALLMVCVSLIDLARETRIALHEHDLRV